MEADGRPIGMQETSGAYARERMMWNDAGDRQIQSPSIALGPVHVTLPGTCFQFDSRNT